VTGERFFDLSSGVTGSSQYFRDHVHVNDRGAELLAQKTADFIEKKILIN